VSRVAVQSDLQQRPQRPEPAPDRETAHRTPAAQAASGRYRADPRVIAPALLIDQRPTALVERKSVGDWEGDLITGVGGLSAIGTLACRRSRHINVIHLPGRRTPDDLAAARPPIDLRLPPTRALR
jgi:IS30 family transposase